MDNAEHFYTKCVESFKQITKKPTQFLEPNEDLLNDIKHNLKQIYDFTKKTEKKHVKSEALSELILKNLDLEQIWQQVELQNDSVLKWSINVVSKLLVSKDRLIFKNIENQLQTQNETDDDQLSEQSSPSEQDLSDVESHSDKVTNDVSDKTRPSVVDDQFFKLAEMEKFLNIEEKKLNEPDSGNDSDSSESESSIDLFEENNEDEEDKMRMAKFRDFFVPNENPKEKVHEQFSDDEEPKSSFELRRDRLNKRIEEIENNTVQDKPWQLQGEITSESRPQNSLLEEVVEFDLSTRSAPVITEQTTMQLEDIIKQRIKDKVFDSVQRKMKPIQTPLEYKKKLVLDQEKSKESLAQIYEKEYLEQQAALDRDNAEKEEKEPELHLEIKTLMKSLFDKLDALSNFHFTPKSAIPELKIISNLPAISMEEVAPVAASDATLLAPEEIKGKPKGDTIGKNERTNTDKNRERRKKKLKQKLHAKEKQKRENLKIGVTNKYSKGKVKDVLEKVMKEKQVEKMKETGKSVTSSTAFFTQLQEEVKNQIKRKAPIKQNKNKIHSAKKLKL